MTTPISSTSSSSRRDWFAALQFGLLVVLLVAALNLVARATEGPERIGALRQKLAQVPGSGSVVIGPSVAKHIVPEAMCLDGPNIAESGRDLFEESALVRNLLERGDPPEVWILGILPGMTLLDNGSPASRGRTRRELTYRTLQSERDWRLIGNDWKSALRVSIAPALGYRDWNFRVRQVWRQVSGTTRSAADVRYSTAVIPDAASDRAAADRWADERIAEFERVDYYDGSVRRRAMDSLLDLDRMVALGGGRLVVVYMPMSPAMQHVLQTQLPDHLQAREAFKARARDAGVVVIDDTAHAGFARNISNFRDPAHLNYAAGLAYSRDLADRLAHRGIIPPPDCRLPNEIR